MDIKVLSSGSSGNCYKITDGKTSLLLECGLPIQKIKQGLFHRLFDVAACLVSHEYQDHCKAVHDIMKAGINVYMSQGTKRVLKLEGHRAKVINSQTSIGTFEVLPFETRHDAEEPRGFLIQSRFTGERCLYATDTYYLPNKFNGLTQIMLEINYSMELLKQNIESGLVNPKLKDRLLQSHMSLENAVEFFKSNDMSRVKEVIVLHMSQGNADEELIKRTIQELIGRQIRIA